MVQCDDLLPASEHGSDAGDDREPDEHGADLLPGCADQDAHGDALEDRLEHRDGSDDERDSGDHYAYGSAYQ